MKKLLILLISIIGIYLIALAVVDFIKNSGENAEAKRINDEAIEELRIRTAKYAAETRRINAEIEAAKTHK